MAHEKIFLTFADSRFAANARRIEEQARAVGVYDKVLAFDETFLDADFRRKNADILNSSTRGFGWWIWKPQSVKQVLASMKDGDILNYADVGCHVNARGKKRLLEYFEIAANAPSGVLAFIQNDSAGSLERVWTKGDLFDAVGVRGNPEITDTPQVAATMFFIRKCPEAEKFVARWLELAEADGHSLIGGAPSRSPNFPEFRDHRHDQSIFSILAKTSAATFLPHSENYPSASLPDGSPDWSTLAEFPLLAMRDKCPKRGFFKQAAMTVLKKLAPLAPTASLRAKLRGIRLS